MLTLDAEQAREFLKGRLKTCSYSNGSYSRCIGALKQLDDGKVSIIIVKEGEENSNFCWQMAGKEMLVTC